MGKTWTNEQSKAIEFNNPQSLLVSAGAGSGKTAVLTQRVITSITRPDNPLTLSRMLIVTFTKAAASELKERIEQAVSDAIAKDPSNEHLAKQMLELESAEICTMDSFFQKLLKAHFADAQVPAHFRIAEENELYSLKLSVMADAIEELYRKNQTSEQGNLTEKLKYNSFANDFMDKVFEGHGEDEAEKTLLSLFESFNNIPNGYQSLKQTSDNSSEYLESPIGKYVVKRTQEELEFLLKRLQAIKKSVPYNKDTAVCLDECELCFSFITNLLTLFDGDSYEKIRSFFTNATLKRDGRNNNKSAYATEIKDATTLRDEIVNYVQTVLPLRFPDEAFLTNGREQNQTVSKYLFDLFDLYHENIMQEKIRRNVLEFNDVRGYVYSLLYQDGKITSLAKSIADNYDAVYVDEYQDIDSVQDKIFLAIGGNKRFLVGDIKQSIYRFRGSQPEIFSGYRSAFPDYKSASAPYANGVTIFMSHNFRCDQPILNFTNKLCAFLFQASKDSVGYQKGDDLIFAKDEKGPFAPVEFHTFAKAGKDEEKLETKWLGEEIKRILAYDTLHNGEKVKASDIAVLLRKNEECATVSKDLESMGIRVMTETVDNLTNDSFFILMHDFLSIVDNPYSDLPLSEVLTSFLGGFSSDELDEIAKSAGEERSLFDKLNSYPTEKANQFVLWLNGYREYASHNSVNKIIRKAMTDPIFATKRNDTVMRYYYEEARKFQTSSYCGLFAFLDRFEKMLSMKEGKINAKAFRHEENAVTVMTVHKSKGLEFPIVFLPKLDDKILGGNSNSSPILYHSVFGVGTGIWNEETHGNTDTTERAIIKECNVEEEKEEVIRVLYVAFTRARERLILSATLPAKLETCEANATKLKFGGRRNLLGTDKLFYWIYAGIKATEPWDSSVFRLIHHDEVAEQADDEEKTSVAVEIPYNPFFSENELPISEEKSTYPVKIAATMVKKNLLDLLQEEENTKADTLLSMISQDKKQWEDFLLETKKASATDVGTANHTFLQYCNYERLTFDWEKEADQLCKDGYLTKKMRGILNRNSLSLLPKSDLSQYVRDAKSAEREYQFHLFYPMSKLTQVDERRKELKNRKIFVQGSIDLLLTTKENRKWIIDYKSDYIPKENASMLREFFASRYAEQLQVYKQAVTEIYQESPEKILIYSLPLGKCIDMTDVIDIL